MTKKVTSNVVAGLFDTALKRHQDGNLSEAELLYRQVLEINAHHSDALNLLGLIAFQVHRHEIALGLFSQAIQIRANNPAYYNNLGLALRGLGRLEDAAIPFEEAIRLAPQYVEAYINFGVVLNELGQNIASIKCHQTAICLKPDQADPYFNLGNALQILDHHNSAIAAYSLATRLVPDHARAHFNASLSHLLLGEFANGWAKYEWRWQGGIGGLLPRSFSQRQWRGENIAGQTILLHSEQGLGDTIQFCRYARLVSVLGAKVILEVPGNLVRLLSTLDGVAQIIKRGDPLPGFDYHCPLMSLPLAFGTVPESIPSVVPYLAAEPAIVSAWQSKLGQNGLRVGIAWQGSPTNMTDKRRSIPLRLFNRLGQMPGIRFISLQKTYGLEQMEDLPEGMSVEMLGTDFDSGEDAFIDTAAVMMNLDIIITVDTSICHLAGALGRPVWVPLANFPHWVWMSKGDRTAWYKTMRLFRLGPTETWEDVFDRIAADLRSIAT